MELREYVVAVIPKNPTWCNKAEVIYVYAKSNSDAIKQARKEIADAGWTKHDGALLYRARLNKV